MLAREVAYLVTTTLVGKCFFGWVHPIEQHVEYIAEILHQQGIYDLVTQFHNTFRFVYGNMLFFKAMSTLHCSESPTNGIIPR
jgi:hypothetical protein